MTTAHGRNPRIAVLGGGPGGLYAARLLKLARPEWDVDVYEQFHPKDTFGFGVGMSSSTQRNLGRADPETLADIDRVAHRGHGARLHTRRGVARLDSQDQLAIARAALLQILYEHGESIGVRMQIGRAYDHREIDADVVIAADGAGSPTRRALTDELGATVDQGRAWYLWCGTDFALPDGLFAPVVTEFGVFTCHAYPYAADRSTFLVETDEETFRAAGLDAAAAATPPAESDVTSIDYLQGIFADHLGGHRLLGNRTRWTRFRTVRCARWHAGNVVLVGDAAHTAHYSIGSGTKLAMEDAIALAEALTSTRVGDRADLTAAFETYQAARMPAVAHLQRLADRSQLWWESFARRIDFSPGQLATSFVTRAGNVGIDAFTESAPHLARPALQQYGDGDVPDGSVIEWIVTQPLHHPQYSSPTRIVDEFPSGFAEVDADIVDTWGDAADEFVTRCAGLLDGGARALRLTGTASRDAVLHRLDLAERLHLDLAGRAPLTVVDGPRELLADLAAGLVSARTDLISLQ